MKQRVGHWILGLMGVLLMALLIGLLALPYAKGWIFFHLVDSNNQQIYLLGTIQENHLQSSAYSLWHLKALLQHLRPELLVVEGHSVPNAEAGYGDGSLEMAFATLEARALGIKVVEVSVADCLCGAEPCPAESFLPLPGEARTVLILVDLQRLQAAQSQLVAAGYHSVPFALSEKMVLFDTADIPARFPAGMSLCLKEQILRGERSLLEVSNPRLENRVRRALAARRDWLTVVQAVGERTSAVPGK